jgi:hypothetical protein
MQSIDIDFDLAKTILPELAVNILKHLDAKLFNIDCWNQDYQPCISSLFIIGSGSYDFEDDTYGIIYIHNGTLSQVRKYDWDQLSRKYYDAYKKNLQSKK